MYGISSGMPPHPAPTPEADSQNRVRRRNARPRQKAERPPKPYPTFPLSPHVRGYWYKKIAGRQVPFGKWEWPDRAAYERSWKAALNGPIFDAARKALESAFGKAPVVTGEGGSIPVVSDFEQILGAPVLLVGFGLPGENAHAPDEWISEENFRLGMRAMAEMWDHYAAAVAAA